MKAASADVLRLLNSNQFTFADLYTITTKGGTVLRLTTADIDITYGGNLFSSNAPLVKSSKPKTATGLGVSTLNLSLIGGLNQTVGAFPFPAFAAMGGFDGATVSIDRCFMPRNYRTQYQQTAQAGAGSSLTLSASSQSIHDFYKGDIVAITGGTGANQERNIVASRQILIKYTQSFNNAYWAKTGLQPFGSGSIANAIAAPDGSITADLIVEDASAANNHALVVSSAFSPQVGLQYTFTWRIKSYSANRKFRLAVGGALGQWTTGNVIVAANFDPDAGTVTEITGACASATITPDPNGGGWYDCKMTSIPCIATAATTIDGYLYNGSIIYNGDGVSGMYVWGANLYEGIDALDFIHIEGSLAVGITVDRPWTTPPDSTSVYDIMDTATSGFTDTRAGTISVFSGIVTDVKPSRNQVDLTVSSDIVLLNIQMPRNLFQPSCGNTLYDTGCTMLKSLWVATGLATAGSTQSVINNNTAQPAGYFNQGTITWTSGANNGFTRTIKSQTVGQFTLAYPLPFAPAVNDTFNVYPGCDKTLTTCTSKFSNSANFRAFPYVPAPQVMT